jgi:hypothetical protein
VGFGVRLGAAGRSWRGLCLVNVRSGTLTVPFSTFIGRERAGAHRESRIQLPTHSRDPHSCTRVGLRSYPWVENDGDGP